MAIQPHYTCMNKRMARNILHFSEKSKVEQSLGFLLGLVDILVSLRVDCKCMFHTIEESVCDQHLEIGDIFNETGKCAGNFVGNLCYDRLEIKDRMQLELIRQI